MFFYSLFLYLMFVQYVCTMYMQYKDLARIPTMYLRTLYSCVYLYVNILSTADLDGLNNC